MHLHPQIKDFRLCFIINVINTSIRVIVVMMPYIFEACKFVNLHEYIHRISKQEIAEKLLIIILKSNSQSLTD